MGDPHRSSLFLKDYVLWEGVTVFNEHLVSSQSQSSRDAFYFQSACGGEGPDLPTACGLR